MTTCELAGCVITDDDKNVLLIHRNTPKLVQWEIPGGRRIEGEEWEETAIRETREELGVRVGNLALIGQTIFTGSPRAQYRYKWFRASIIEGSPAPQELAMHDAIDYFNLFRPPAEIKLSASAYALSLELQNNRIKL